MSDLNDFFRRLRSSGTSMSATPAHGTVTAAVAEPKTTVSDVTAMLVSALELEGLKPRIDSDGDIVVQHGRFTMVIIRRGDDPEYLRIVLPNFFRLDSPKTRQQALAAADRVNRKMKVVKLHTGSGDMWACVEMFVANPEQVLPVLMRCIEVLPEAVMLFHATLVGQDE